MAGFCIHCGTQLGEGNAFCAKCGKASGEPEPAAPGPQPSSTPSQSTSPPRVVGTTPVSPPAPLSVTPPSTPKSSNLFLKIVVGVLGLFVLAGAVAIGSCIYIVHRVKNKAEQVHQAYKAGGGRTIPASGSQEKSEEANGLGKILGAISSALPPTGGKLTTHPVEGCPDQDRTGFDAYLAVAGKASIPLKKDLTLVSIWTNTHNRLREVEVLTKVQDITGSEVEITEQMLQPGASPSGRNICIADLLHASAYETESGVDSPQIIRGTTMFNLAPPVFQDLKAGRSVAWMYERTWVRNDELASWQARGQLTRVEANDVPYSVIVNGSRVDLPAIHARATLKDQWSKEWVYEAWFLDDPANPIALNLVRPSDNWHITYVKIDFPVEKKIETDLAQNGRAEIYGIYFDFDSATLRPESGPVLKEIAEALQHNTGWKIKIDGHTDNAGGDAYNLQLSQRRAGAVKQALIRESGIAPDRMMPEGFGASRPKASNDTVEGRALNRRVELVRE